MATSSSARSTLSARFRLPFALLLGVALLAGLGVAWSTGHLTLPAAVTMLVVAGGCLLAGLFTLESLASEATHPLEGAANALDQLRANHGQLERLARSVAAGGDAVWAPAARPPVPSGASTREVETLLQRLSGVVDSQTELEAAVGAAIDAVRSARRTELRAVEGSRNLLQSCAEPTLVVAFDGRVQDCNVAAATMAGTDRGALVGRDVTTLFADRAAGAGALARARASGVLHGESLVLASEARAVELSASVLPGAEGELPRLLVSVRDVTEAKAKALDAEQRARYARSLLEASADALLTIDAEGIVTDVNEAMIKRTGIARDRLIGSRFVELCTEPIPAREAYERTLSDGRVEDAPLTLLHRNGSTLYVTFNATLYRDEGGRVLGAFAALRDVTQARKAELERDQKEWVMSGIARLNDVFQAQADSRALARRIVSELTEYTGSQVGALYLVEAEGAADTLALFASHAFTARRSLGERIRLGEGVLGQAALERKQILLSDVPSGYVPIASALGEATPRSLCVTPLLLEGNVRGMLELASFTPLTAAALEYLRQAAVSVAVALEAATARERVAVALQQSQKLTSELEAQTAELESQAAELEAQQQAMRNTNAELEEQTAQLKLSDQKLRQQQAEIELANTELGAKNDLLEKQKAETEEARRVLAAQAEEVALASKYKSEFLANMSHELRTPLNSLLLLARSLRENEGKNLTAEQVESASVIFESGSDLLNLINEILDLSKIEAGKMELRPEEIELTDLERSLLSQFDHMARAQGLTLEVAFDPGAPQQVFSDPQRLGQVVKNLLGNAIKFTERGGVTVRFARPAPGTQLARSGLVAEQAFVIHVQDTGIGIPLDKQKIIFEAFQQADSGDRRRFGGTGLGLSISRELAALLGGEIQLVSEPGKGSTFSLYLPLSVARRAGASLEERPVVPAPAAPKGPRAPPLFVAPNPAAQKPTPTIEDDRGAIADHDHVILVIEDDLRFAKILAGHVRSRGLKCLVASSGEDGLSLAREHRPDGVVLDIQLPHMDGWAVLNALKQDVSLRHIPVHIVSVEEASAQNLRLGAIGHVAKPIGREQIEAMLQRLESASSNAHKRVLVVEDDELVRKETVRVIATSNVTVDAVGTGEEAIAAIGREHFDLVVMDLGLPDMQGLELLRRLSAEKRALPPVIIHTVRELTNEEEYFLRSYADSIIVKDVRSQERLIDEVALFLHRVVRDLPEENRRAILHLHESNEPLRGRKVLVVEDDMRTMFAMARMLAGHGVHPVKAENGARALELLRSEPDVDLVLMDMMMPVLDGYEATRQLRGDPRFEKLPVIALTAKAMREDREKCLEAGATDYLSKPVDPDRLVSLMRVLLCR